jgi:hypothetical protein
MKIKDTRPFQSFFKPLGRYDAFLGQMIINLTIGLQMHYITYNNHDTQRTTADYMYVLRQYIHVAFLRLRLILSHDLLPSLHV